MGAVPQAANGARGLSAQGWTAIIRRGRRAYTEDRRDCAPADEGLDGQRQPIAMPYGTDMSIAIPVRTS